MESKTLAAIFTLILIPIIPAYADGPNYSLNMFGDFFQTIQEKIIEPINQIIIEPIENIAFHVQYIDELGQINSFVNQYQQYNRDFYNDQMMPTLETVNELSDNVQSLRIVKDNCSKIDMWTFIQSGEPIVELENYCDFPNDFNESIAIKLLNDA